VKDPDEHLGSDTITSTTLLRRVATPGGEAACRDFVRRYTPMVRAIAASCGLSHEDVEDVVQEVMAAAVGALREGRYDRQQGRYKPFLKGIIGHKVRDAMVRGRSAPGLTPDVRAGERNTPDQEQNASAGQRSTVTGKQNASPAPTRLQRWTSRAPLPLHEDVPDPHPSPAEAFEAAFEIEWRKTAMEEALDEIRREFDPATFQAFDLYARKDMPAREVARLLGVSRNAVYIAKTRVLARLRELLGPEAP